MANRWFASDNNSGVHPNIMSSVFECNVGHAIAYGDDKVTGRAVSSIKDCFGDLAHPFFVFNGTAANVLGLKSALSSYNSVLCTDLSHVFVDECGAVENFTGSQLITVPTIDGKLKVSQLESKVKALGVEHHSQPKVISISQATEFGTVYSLEELRELSGFAKKNSLYLHMDGARVANAACSLGVSLKELSCDVGVDILSFGGTKNGLMFGEALIFFNSELARNFKFIRKQGMQLASKMRYIAAQFEAYLKDDLWRENASHANSMARLLESKLKCVNDIEIVQPVDANAIFARVPKSKIKSIQDKFFFYVWDEDESIVRWMTSFDTTTKDIDDFVNQIRG